MNIGDVVYIDGKSGIVTKISKDKKYYCADINGCECGWYRVPKIISTNIYNNIEVRLRNCEERIKELEKLL